MSKLFTQFYYNKIDGTAPTIIRAGENGVTQEHINLLVEWEKTEKAKREYREDEKEVPFDDYMEYVLGVQELDEAEEQDTEQACMEAKLRACIERLKPVYQDLYYKTMGMRMTYEEIAEERGVTKQAIYSQMQTLKRKLKKMMEEN